MYVGSVCLKWLTEFSDIYLTFLLGIVTALPFLLTNEGMTTESQSDNKNTKTYWFDII